MLYPLKLKAPLKDYIWGGKKLKTQFGKESALERIAESWELSCHKDGSSKIENGCYQGWTLADYIDAIGKNVIGTNAAALPYFPILIKLIDAKDNLSVQVHPDNEYALRVEGEYGKTEMWYIIDCEKDAALLYGFNKEISKAEFRQRIEDNTLLAVCNRIPVKKGDVFFVEAGTLHAIGKGIVIAEIQQNSNTTYRMYDYGRIAADGQPRPLHVEQALAVTKRSIPQKTSKSSAIKIFADCDLQILAECSYFTVYYLHLKHSCNFVADERSFQSILLLDGAMTLQHNNKTMSLQKGDSVFIPAGMGQYSLSGNGEIIFSMI